MQLKLLKSKIQGLRITGKELYYEGSLQLDQLLLKSAKIVPGEIVQVVNINNGERFETYVIPAPEGSGVCCLKGAAARLGEVGDEVIVMSMVYLDEPELSRHRIVKVRVDKNNKIVKEETAGI
jgi:aspartate 1-decarboxylase|uniref:Aspartate 1-decarboxylase n=1 Tax=candidate division WOR-3 bacterium TaxID=2052148 RepID=A0A7V3V006_UNCW3